MQGNQVGFESSLQQHLDTEQRRAVLEAIGGSINPDSTLGEIIDAAEALGWSDKLGDLSLADLAEALLAPNGESTSGVTAKASEPEAADEDEDDEEAAGDEDDDEDEDDDDDDDDFVLEVQEPTSRRKAGKVAAAKQARGAASKKAAAASASKKAASKKAVEAEPMRGGKKAAKKVASKPGRKAVEELASKPGRKAVEELASKPGRKAAEAPAARGKKATSKKAGAARRKPAAVDVDDRMSLDEAADFFLPVVEEIGEATMQALEEQTGVSRRKLRFHVGQLVKHGYLERHGMGRGTYYTRR